MADAQAAQDHPVDHPVGAWSDIYDGIHIHQLQMSPTHKNQYQLQKHQV